MFTSHKPHRQTSPKESTKQSPVNLALALNTTCSSGTKHPLLSTTRKTQQHHIIAMSFFSRSFPALNRLKQLAFRPRGVEEFFENGKSIPTEKSWTGKDSSQQVNAGTTGEGVGDLVDTFDCRH